ncbi:MAG: T9SS type A sorting domain-containing protein, partial [Fibrobacterota bacterium]
LFPQTQWEKYQLNPVMMKQNTTYDWAAIGQPACILENDTFKMWYVAAGNPCRTGLPYTGRILCAYSTDGIQWHNYHNGTPVLDVGTLGQWDDTWLDTPEILHDAQGYKLFYFGDTTYTYTHYLSPYVGIGLAVSSDGINNWQRVGNGHVLGKGNPGEWDDMWIESPAVCYDTASSTYLMWYTGITYSVALSDWHCQIGLATSTNCTTWTKHPGNPVIPTGASGDWNDKWVSVPSVIKHGNVYEMWFSAKSSVGSEAYIGYASSSNGSDWTVRPEPLFSTFTAPYDSAVETGGPWAPDVVWDGTGYSMWYETAAGFCLAQAPRDVHIEVSPPLRVMEPAVFPNPFNTHLSVRYQCEKNVSGSIRIYTLNGRRLLNQTIRNAGTWVWDASSFSSGVYIVETLLGQRRLINRVMILR